MDTLVVLGKNWRRDRSDLSVESKLNALAAAEVVRSKPMLVVFGGGYTAGHGRLSEAAAMSRYAARCVALPDVLLEEESIDTAGNAEMCRILLGLRHISLLTGKEHGPGAVSLFRYTGFVVDRLYAAEEVVSARSSHHARLLERRQASAGMRRARLVERARSVVLFMSPSGRALRPITRLLRR